QTAQKVPSIQDGDWKVLPEGGMEVTWKINPGVVWHDGTPLTSDDLVFGYQINVDPEIPTNIPGSLTNVTGVRAIDPQTIVVSWKTVSIDGGISGYDGIPAAARHIFGDLYAADMTAFQTSPYWNTQWIGLGPYRLTRWERGSF